MRPTNHDENPISRSPKRFSAERMQKSTRGHLDTLGSFREGPPASPSRTPPAPRPDSCSPSSISIKTRSPRPPGRGHDGSILTLGGETKKMRLTERTQLFYFALPSVAAGAILSSVLGWLSLVKPTCPLSVIGVIVVSDLSAGLVGIATMKSIPEFQCRLLTRETQDG